MTHDHCLSGRSFTLILAAAALWLAALGRAVVAQEAPAAAPAAPAAAPDAAAGEKKWKEDVVPAAFVQRSSPERARLLRELPQIMNGGTPLDDNGKAVIDAWYGQVVFAEMTHVANLARLTDMRQTFRNRSLRPSNIAEPARVHLNDLVLRSMSKIAHDNGYHPAVRVNAMLMVADLNQKEAAVAAGKATPAAPLTAALTQRQGLLESAADTTLHTGVRATALYGVQRHADAGVAAANQGAVQARMLAILKEKSVAPTNSQGLAWLKMRAAAVLETMAPAAGGGAIAGEMATVLGDEAAPVDLRCAAARALGAQKGLAAGAVNLPEVIAALGNLQLDHCREELDRAAVEQDTVAPRQIHHRTSAVQAALGDGKSTGVAVLVAPGDANKALTDAVAKNVTETLALVPDENAEPTEQLKVKADELEKLLADNKVLKSQPRSTAAPAADTPASTPAKTDAKAATTNAAAPKTGAAGTK